MRLGLMVGYSGSQIAIDIKQIQEAERLGYDSVWTAEAWGSDAFTPAAWIGAHTERIRLCTGIVQISARTAASCAMHTLTIDHLTNGRFSLGLGVSGPVVRGLTHDDIVRRAARGCTVSRAILEAMARRK